MATNGRRGERSRREGGKVFGQGSRAPVAVTVLVRNPDADPGCRIFYRDIGNYLTREDKLARLREWGSVAGMSDWQEIAPDRHQDWIGQRDVAFEGFYPVGSKAAKAGKSQDAIFRLFSNGYQEWPRFVCLQLLKRRLCPQRPTHGRRLPWRIRSSGAASRVHDRALCGPSIPITYIGMTS